MSSVTSPVLFTDQYELVMAQGYWKEGMAEWDSNFYMFYRKPPFGGSFALMAGLEAVCECLERWRLGPEDLDYLRSLELFDGEFLSYLSQLRLNCRVYAMPEGTPVFPFEPMVRVEGPLVQCQLIEGLLLNQINFATLIATKAARICYAAQGDPVVEFGLRRAQGADGALTASRSAFIGGCCATSHVWAGQKFGIPISGTQAHSWIMAFDEEIEAFRAFNRSAPGGTVLLVDTYSTLEGVRRAIRLAQELQWPRERWTGVRLDSGDPLTLSRQVRRLLDGAGYQHVQIVASNELDELTIAKLKEQKAPIDRWGVGTHLVTGRGQGALDGVYKISGLRRPGGDWSYRLKLSEEQVKISHPGLHQVRRYSEGGRYHRDVIYDLLEPLAEDAGRDLLELVFDKGRRLKAPEPLQQIQERAYQELERLTPAHRSLEGAIPYPVALEPRLQRRKEGLVAKESHS
jgi:nicotinate phosphoribosyltransferase